MQFDFDAWVLERCDAWRCDSPVAALGTLGSSRSAPTRLDRRRRSAADNPSIFYPWKHIDSQCFVGFHLW